MVCASSPAPSPETVSEACEGLAGLGCLTLQRQSLQAQPACNCARRPTHMSSSLANKHAVNVSLQQVDSQKHLAT